jgi:hypothetical protein
MKKKLLILILIVLIALISYYFLKEKEYRPGILFEINKNSIETFDGRKSDEIVSVTIKKMDNRNIPTNFTLKFIPSDPDYAYPISVYTNERISEITTRTLIDMGSSDIIQFKVFGRIMGNQPYSPYTIKIELYYNDTKLDERILNVIVRR